MRADIFDRDFKPPPYWWEAYRPAAGELVEVPREARVAIVGGGYAGLSAALELAKHGIDAVVFETRRARRRAPARATAARSAAASISARASAARPAQVDAERAGIAVRRRRRLRAGRAADRRGSRSTASGRSAAALSAPGRQQHFAYQASAARAASTTTRSRAPTWCRASGSATRSPATITSAAWSSSARRTCIRRSTTRGCSTPAAGAASRSAPMAPVEGIGAQRRRLAGQDQPRRRPSPAMSSSPPTAIPAR